jgi:hypothetical protein
MVASFIDIIIIIKLAVSAFSPMHIVGYAIQA